MSFLKKYRGEAALSVSALFFSLTAISVKSAAGDFSGPEIAFVRFVVEIILCSALIYFSRSTFRVRGAGTWVLRGLFGAGSMVLYFTAIRMTSSGRATLLFNTYPVFVAVTGALFFKRKIEIKHIISLFLCAAGVAVVFYDGSSYGFEGDIVGLLSGVLAGVAIHYVQKSREKNGTALVYMSAALFGLIFTSPHGMTAGYVPGTEIMVLIAVGALSLVSQLTMTYGFKYIHPTRGSILAYSSLPLTLLGSFFLGEEFTMRFFAGIVLIFAGLWVNLKKR